MGKFIAWTPVFDPFATDKQLHFLGGFLLVATTGIFLSHITCGILLTGVALGKEVYDYFHENHSCEMADFTATICGGIIAGVILKPLFMLIDILLFNKGV
jgi:hypothetical protein